MIVSENTASPASAFALVLDKSVRILKHEAANDAKKFLASAGTKLEGLVLDALNEAASGTEFENTIRLASGQKFPDIVLQAGGLGVEVKSTTQDHWITTGNSVLESTRIADINKIFLLFGKLASPIDFKARPYEDCLKEVLVTHYPRYQIDMNLPPGQTIFDKVGKSYDEIRSLPEPVAPIIEYYSSKLSPGESLWWISNKNIQEQSSPITIRELSSLCGNDRNNIVAKSLVLFPQLFGNRQDKFHDVLMWLLRNGLICGNIRDFYTAGGTWNNLPQIVHRLYKYKEKFALAMITADTTELQQSWHVKVCKNANRLPIWFSLLSKATNDRNIINAVKRILLGD